MAELDKNKAMVLVAGNREGAGEAAAWLVSNALDLCGYLHVSAVPSDNGVRCSIDKIGASGLRELLLDEIVEIALFEEQLAKLALSTLFPDARFTGEGSSLELESSIEKNSLDGSILTKRTETVLSKIRDGNDVRLVGQSGSGKSICAAQVANQLMDEGWNCAWIDLSMPDRSAADFILWVLKNELPCGLLVLDDTQANPSETFAISVLLREFNELLGNNFRLIVLGWESFADPLEEHFSNTAKISCHGHHILPSIANELVENVTTDVKEEIRRQSGGDLVVAHVLIEFLKQKNHLPTPKELSEAAFKRVAGGNDLGMGARETLYRLASLAQYEIDVSIQYLESFSQEGVEELKSFRSVRMNGGYVSIGHRSLSQLVMKHIVYTWPELAEELPNPTNQAVKYIRAAPPIQLLTTLERLDLASLTAKHDEHMGSSFLARAWRSLGALVEHVAKQTSNDPTWGDNTASTVFAAEALAEVGHPSWWQTATYLRQRWQIEHHALHFEGDTPNERIDFEEIRKCMIPEEEMGGLREWQELSQNIDFDLMHKNWVLGLLLGFEGRARASDPKRIQALLLAVKSLQLEDGAFHPRRVPWVSARILLGMAAAGESIQTNQVVRDCCRWLISDDPDGPYRFGTWEGGTGTWNTTLGTTAMCLSALIACGVSPSEPVIKESVSYLLTQRAEWITVGKEIDGSFAMATALAVDGRWRDLQAELDHLLGWVRDKEAWDSATATADELHDESCKVAQVASSLISIVWSTVRADLPLLLKDLVLLPDTYIDPKQEAKDVDYGVLGEILTELIEDVTSQIRERERLVAQEEVADSEDSTLEVLLEARKEARTDLWEIQRQLLSNELVLDDQLLDNINSLGELIKSNAWKTFEINWVP